MKHQVCGWPLLGAPLFAIVARPTSLSRGLSARFRSFACVLACALLSACGGSNPGHAGKSDKVIAPSDMPEICRDIDFNTTDAGLREECGVKTRNYKAYRNIPEHRSLLVPKNGKVVQRGDGLELRLEGFLPVDLPRSLNGQIDFDEKVRRQLLKSRYAYFEHFTPKASRPDKLIQIEIPTRDSNFVAVCFFVERPRVTAQRKTGYASRLLSLDCQEWQRRKAQADSAESFDPAHPAGSP